MISSSSDFILFSFLSWSFFSEPITIGRLQPHYYDNYCPRYLCRCFRLLSSGSSTSSHGNCTWHDFIDGTRILEQGDWYQAPAKRQLAPGICPHSTYAAYTQHKMREGLCERCRSYDMGRIRHARCTLPPKAPRSERLQGARLGKARVP